VSPGTQAIRILIADDHPIFRDGLRRLLETAPDLRIVGDTDGLGAITLVQTLRPDILLLGGSPQRWRRSRRFNRWSPPAPR
jgi:DNA-binding NarL/FixJ family response regulator